VALLVNADGIPGPLARPNGLIACRLSTRSVGRPTGLRVGTLFCLTTIFWRITPVVDFGVTHAWLAPAESIVLVGVGLLFGWTWSILHR